MHTLVCSGSPKIINQSFQSKQTHNGKNNILASHAAFLTSHVDFSAAHVNDYPPGHTVQKSNQNFRDTTRNVQENEILHEIFRKVSRFPHYISCYISENRLPLGQCTACCTRSHFDTRLSCAWIFVGKNGKSHTYKSENRYVLVVSFLIFLAILNRSKTVRKHFSN